MPVRLVVAVLVATMSFAAGAGGSGPPARTAATCLYDVTNCVPWDGVATRVHRCQPVPRCYSGRGFARKRKTKIEIDVNKAGTRITETTISQACGGIGGDVGNVRIRRNGRFSFTYNFRNPQSGDTVFTRVYGRIKGNTLTGRSYARYTKPLCKSADVTFVAHRRVAKKPKPKPAPKPTGPGFVTGHYAGSGEGATISFDASATAITSIHATATGNCFAGSSWNPDVTVASAPIKDKSATFEATDAQGGTVDGGVGFEDDGTAGVELTGNVTTDDDVCTFDSRFTATRQSAAPTRSHR